MTSSIGLAAPPPGGNCSKRCTKPETMLLLEWELQVSLEEGLEKTYRWIRMMVEKDKEGKGGAKG